MYSGDKLFRYGRVENQYESLPTLLSKFSSLHITINATV
jgi:hypothetical protein